jgi:hypothetical protein
MAHWRDGGIGNMAGSDDRPIEEWTLLEKLAEIADAVKGGPIPRCMLGEAHDDWATPLKAIAQEAFDEIERLRTLEKEIGEAMGRSMNNRPLTQAQSEDISRRSS